MRCRALLVVLVLVVATACSSVSNGTPVAGVVAGSSGPLSSGPTHGGAPDLTSQLLSISEMPAGWSIDTSSNSDDNTGEPPCLQHGTSSLDASVKAERNFIGGSDFPLMNEDIYYYGSSSNALRSYGEGKALLDGCKTLSFTTNGAKVTGTLRRLSFPAMGDRLTAWQLLLSVSTVTVAFDVIVVVKGAELLLMLYANIGSVDTGPVATFVRKAVAKLPA